MPVRIFGRFGSPSISLNSFLLVFVLALVFLAMQIIFPKPLQIYELTDSNLPLAILLFVFVSALILCAIQSSFPPPLGIYRLIVGSLLLASLWLVSIHQPWQFTALIIGETVLVCRLPLNLRYAPLIRSSFVSMCVFLLIF